MTGRSARRRAAWCLGIALAAPACAADGDAAFAAQWPLTLPAGDAGAYQVELDPAIYATTVDADLRDLVVVNGAGRQVPALLVAAPESDRRREARALAWFPLPDAAARAGSDIAAISELDPDGRLRRIQWRPARRDAPPAAVLVDAGQDAGALEALVLDWGVADAPFERTLRVERSDDLRTWQPVPAGARLLDLRRGDARLVERRIAFDAPVRARYLRLTPAAGAGAMPALRALTGESTAAPAPAPVTWHALTPVRDGDGFVYRLDARLPVSRIDLGLPGHTTARWTLSVREADEMPWRVVVRDWLVYRVGGEVTPPQVLAPPSRARDWRLQSAAETLGAPPTLRLGYRPERLVFVAEGAPPFALRAGSRQAVRDDAPVAALLEALRARHGVDWQPPSAALGPRSVLAGDAALDAPPLRDGRTWLLWGVLLLGVGLVGGFAISLLRAPRSS